jgi:hypothetical protein
MLLKERGEMAIARMLLGVEEESEELGKVVAACFRRYQSCPAACLALDIVEVREGTEICTMQGEKPRNGDNSITGAPAQTLEGGVS